MKGKASLSGRSSKSDEEQIAADNEELIRFARQHFSTDFPNPDQIGCPSSETLLATVRAGLLPDDELTNHLFACSTCFTEYRAALAQRHSEEAVTISHWWQHWASELIAAISFKSVLVSVGLIILGTVGFWAWHSRPSVQSSLQPQIKPQIDQVAAASSSKNIRSESTSSTLQVLTATKTRHKRPVTGRRQNLDFVVADLSDYVTVRSMDARRGPLQLPHKRLRLKLFLPEGCLPGSYTIAVTGSGNQEVIAIRAHTPDGKIMAVPLNLTMLPLGSYRLSLRYKERDEYTFSITIVD